MELAVQVGAVTVERTGELAFVTLCNPSKRNAMSRAMWVQLRSLFSSKLSPFYGDIGQNSIQNTPIKAIVLRGAACQDGSAHFCAGGDISEYPSFRFDEAQLRYFHEQEVAPALDAMLACDLPLIAQIDGFCMGGGLEIAACCDIRLAGQAAVFGAPIAKLGFPMAPREAAIVVQAVGASTARQMLLAAQTFNAQQMLQSGFLGQVAADAQVAEHALQMAHRIAQLSTQAAALNKQTLRAILKENTGNVTAESTDIANDLIANPYAYAAAPHHKEGIQAFLEKRSPHFENI